MAKIYKKHLISSKTSNANLDQTPSHYIHSISNHRADPMDQQPVKTKKLHFNLAFSESREFPLHERLLILLVSAHVISHSVMTDIWTEENYKIERDGLDLELIGEEDLMAHLPQIAYNIHGLWVIKSNLLYENRIRDARDVLLAQLLSDGLVKRAEWSKKVEMNGYMGENMLGEICVYEKEKNGWGWKVECDPSFEVSHPALQKKHHDAVLALALKALETFAPKVVMGPPKKGTPTEKNSISIPSTSRRSSLPPTQLEEFELEGNTAPDQAQNMVRSILKKHGVMDRSHIQQLFNFQVKSGTTL
jgi:hypothetical protein